MTVNYLVTVTGALSGVMLFALGLHTEYLLFKKKKDAVACYEHLVKQVRAMYPDCTEEVLSEAVCIRRLELYDGPMFLNFVPKETKE